MVIIITTGMDAGTVSATVKPTKGPLCHLKQLLQAEIADGKAALLGKPAIAEKGLSRNTHILPLNQSLSLRLGGHIVFLRIESLSSKEQLCRNAFVVRHFYLPVPGAGIFDSGEAGGGRCEGAYLSM